MVVIHRTVRRLKDTFQYTRPYDEIKSRRRIMGRRVRSTKKLLSLPFNPDSNNNVNEIPAPPPLPSSFRNQKQLSNESRHDMRQSKLKDMLIDELKSFFISRNENYPQLDHHVQSEINLSYEPTNLKENYSIQSTMESRRTTANKTQIIEARTSLFTPISLLMNLLLRNPSIQTSGKTFNLLTNTLIYSTSFTCGCFGAQCIRQTKLSSPYQFGRILTRSVLLQTCLTLLVGTRSSTQRALPLPTSFSTSATSFLYKRDDILLRIITSVLHLITGFVISLDSQNIL